LSAWKKATVEKGDFGSTFKDATDALMVPSSSEKPCPHTARCKSKNYGISSVEMHPNGLGFSWVIFVSKKALKPVSICSFALALQMSIHHTFFNLHTKSIFFDFEIATKPHTPRPQTTTFLLPSPKVYDFPHLPVNN
jgi:hypothetical protein